MQNVLATSFEEREEEEYAGEKDVVEEEDEETFEKTRIKLDRRGVRVGNHEPPVLRVRGWIRLCSPARRENQSGQRGG